jgi:predicted TIM-barrel fold metal-dependent hydrolase
MADLIKVIQLYPNIGFTIALMGWPLDISEEGYQRWVKDIKRLSQCKNICVDISAIECIFGMDWTMDQITPWILSAIEIFGTERSMFGSHMPIAKLSRSFTDLYAAYEKIIADFSLAEKENGSTGIAGKTPFFMHGRHTHFPAGYG